MMTERGMPSQLQQKLIAGELKMNFGGNNIKHKSSFGVDGAQLNPKKGVPAVHIRQTKNERQDFAISQKINKASLPAASYKASRRSN